MRRLVYVCLARTKRRAVMWHASLVRLYAYQLRSVKLSLIHVLVYFFDEPLLEVPLALCYEFM